jgi:hypothetical protein
MNPTQQAFYDLIADRFHAIERERSRNDLLHDLLAAKLDGRITEQEYRELVERLNGPQEGGQP